MCILVGGGDCLFACFYETHKCLASLWMLPLNTECGPDCTVNVENTRSNLFMSVSEVGLSQH
jgi:hypothetical protein